MALLLNDLRYALRGLRRSPLFATVAILSLALGIGANAAIFTLIDQVVLRKLPVKSPEQLVMLYQSESIRSRRCDTSRISAPRCGACHSRFCAVVSPSPP